MAVEGEEEEEEAEATFDDVENNAVSSEDKDGAPVEAYEPTEPAIELGICNSIIQAWAPCYGSLWDK